MSTTAVAVTAKELAEFAKVSELSIAEQARHFLRAFISDFTDGTHNIEEVLDLSVEFAKYTDAKNKDLASDEEQELDEVKFHLFLERRGETMTIVEVRDKMREIDIDSNHQISFMEYCLFKYEKTLGQLLAPNPEIDDELLRQLNEAIAAYEAVLAKRQARLDRLAHLREIAASGGSVRGNRARLQIQQIEHEDQLAQNKAEVTSDYRKRMAERALSRRGPLPAGAAGASRGLRHTDSLEAEEAKLAAKRAAEAEQQALERRESKARLSARASQWNLPATSG